MNVRVHPSIRCTLDAGENVLRLILKETVDKAENREPELVVYALKVSNLPPIVMSIDSLSNPPPARKVLLEAGFPGLRKLLDGEPRLEASLIGLLIDPRHGS